MFVLLTAFSSGAYWYESKASAGRATQPPQATSTPAEYQGSRAEVGTTGTQTTEPIQHDGAVESALPLSTNGPAVVTTEVPSPPRFETHVRARLAPRPPTTPVLVPVERTLPAVVRPRPESSSTIRPPAIERPSPASQVVGETTDVPHGVPRGDADDAEIIPPPPSTRERPEN